MLEALRERVHSTEPAPARTSLNPDDVYDILSNERRRLILDHIEDRAWTLDDLATAIAGLENDKPPRLVDSQEKKRCYVGMYQCHLSQLDGLGVVDWDKRSGHITKGPEYEGVRRIQKTTRGLMEGDA